MSRRGHPDRTDAAGRDRSGRRRPRDAARTHRDAPGQSRLRVWLRDKRPVLRFAGLFVASLAVFYALTATPQFRGQGFPSYLKLNASVSAWLLRRCGENVTASGTVIASPRYALAIQRGCDALEPVAVFVSAVVALPVAWRLKLSGALLGAVCLSLMNLCRIVTLYYVGIRAPRFFEAAHADIWQPLFILVALVLWMAWGRRAMSIRTVSRATA